MLFPDLCLIDIWVICQQFVPHTIVSSGTKVLKVWVPMHLYSIRFYFASILMTKLSLAVEYANKFADA